LLGVPTHVITGFLGVGKTTAILNLIQQKPAGERWAILINEFGEIGVDGGLVQGQVGDDQGVFIREVPGGCMCCAAGLPMQIALNQLLRRARPDRLIIEPTGLGHPREVLQALAAEHYRDVLSVKKAITLLDARNLSDDRYVSHPTFVQQLAIADLVVANKQDLYADVDRERCEAFVLTHCRPEVQVLYTQQGRFALADLEGPCATVVDPAAEHAGSLGTTASDLPFPPSGYVTAQNSGEGFESIGWRFSPDSVFDRDRLVAFMRGLDVERLKAVFITSQGIFGYNMTRDELTEQALDDCMESRIEIITDSVNQGWESSLTACLDTSA
jgi:G3E family GTPase